MFDDWEVSGEFPTLFEVERDVLVDMGRLYPPAATRKDQLPLWVKSFGLLINPRMPARQRAWIRRADGGWLAYVQLPAASANERSALTMDLWLPPEAFTVIPPLNS